MFDLILVLVLHVSLLQLLGRRLPGSQPTETGRGSRCLPCPSWETAEEMIERAFPSACSDLYDDRSSSREG
jgi:hypothetical protein